VRNKANSSCQANGVHGTPCEVAENALRQTKPISMGSPLPGEDASRETKPICMDGKWIVSAGLRKSYKERWGLCVCENKANLPGLVPRIERNGTMRRIVSVGVYVSGSIG